MPAHNPIELDAFPFPRRDLISIDDYYTLANRRKMMTTYSSRGCPFKCIFCDVVEKKFHYRSAKNLADEFENILKMGIEEIHILDDTFNLRRQRVIDFCNEIIDRGIKAQWSVRARVFPFDDEMAYLLKKAGCSRFHVGVETLDEDLLKYIKKGITLKHINKFFALCKKYKIDTLAYFIVGFPNETEEYRLSLFKNIMELNPTYIYINILLPLPATKLYQEMLDSGIYKKDIWLDFIRKPVRDFNLASFRPVEQNKEIRKFVDDLHLKFYLNPRFVFREILKDQDLRTIAKKIKAAFKLIKSRIYQS